MLPVIALLGRPNVGKSTLFNRLTRTRDALVADMPGLTRDRQYGVGKIGRSPYIVVDTGGLGGSDDQLADLVTQQARRAAEEADVLLFLVDGREGLNGADEDIAQILRRLGKPLYLVVNKAEHLDKVAVSAEFHRLALGEPHPVSATHNHGIAELLDEVLATLATADGPADGSNDGDTAGEVGETDVVTDTTNESDAPQAAGEDGPDERIRLAIVGRPNVGKSTLVNRLLGETRVLTSDLPGTTRDSIAIPFARDGRTYTLIDTAGIRRRSRVHEAIEKFSIIKTLQAIEAAHVVVLMLDARQGIADQDATLLGYVLDSGRALVVAINKWDHLGPEVRQQVRREVERKLPFLDYARIHYISALHGSGILEVLGSVDAAHAAATRKLSTPELTRILAEAVNAHQPPLVQGRRTKLRYAHQGGQNPPLIVIHGSRTDHIPAAYRRYLEKSYRQALALWGTPIRIEFRTGDNPYAPSHPPRRPLPRPQRAGVKGTPSKKSRGRGP
ncbi:MAG: ribosome biogenesis GTPase Der [Gammaproteobacteria bacterium]|nr:ribosome biogenesis GTPase Der [Gammaproteobacteria bacterium]MCP5423836.1 ribosome biogenesis GTPase Der [Gammaproteobacteria bacterium]